MDAGITPSCTFKASDVILPNVPITEAKQMPHWQESHKYKAQSVSTYLAKINLHLYNQLQ